MSPTSNSETDLEYALFSAAEMQRRYARARELMAEHQIDALFITGEENFQYFAGAAASVALHHSLTRPSVFILPLEREPIIITQGRDNLSLGSYVTDIRDFTDLYSFPHDLTLKALADAASKHARIGAELGLEQRMGMPAGAYCELVAAMPGAAFVDAADIIITVRMVKSGEELAYMRKAADVTGRARQRLFDQIAPDMTEREVARLMRRLILEEGGDRTAFVILQSDSPGSSNPFHYDRPLQKGSVLAVDAGACIGMHEIDYVRMATLGMATDEQRLAHEAVLEVNAKMAEALRPGITCSELYRIGTEAVEAGGGDLKRFGPPRMGHGQGMLVTEPPSISPDDHTALEAGVVLSTEPGVSIGGVQLLWEDVHVITEDGREQLTLESCELREISV